MKSLRLFILVSFFSQLGWCSPTCEFLLLNTKLSVTTTSREVNPLQLEEMAQVILDIHRFLTHVQQPRAAKIELQLEGDFAVAIKESISVPYRFRRTVDGVVVLKELKDSKAVLAHEYGHLIFEAGVRSRDPRLAELAEKSEKLETRFNALMQENAPMSRVIVVAQERLAVSKEQQRLLEFYNGYSELFSDVVAVLYSGDGQSISKTVADPLKYRDFTETHELNTWVESAEAHNRFAPTRHYLWKTFLAAPHSVSEKAVFLQRFFEAVYSEFFTRSRNPDLENISPTEANRRLIDAIKQRM